MKRFIAFFLSALILSGALFSCAKSIPEKNGQSENGSFPTRDYKGEDFTFLAVKHTETITDYYGGSYLDADTYTGNTVSSAVYERNLAVEENYNVKIKEIVKIGSDPKEVITSYRLSGDICFDAVYGWGYKLFSCIPNGAFTDISKLEGVDLSKSYWAPSALADLMIKDSLYVATNDISMNKTKWADVVFVNNTVLARHTPEYSLAELALDGGWTYDKYLKLICDYSADGTYGLVTDDTSGSSVAHGADIYYTYREDNNIKLNLSCDKLFDLIDNVHKVYSKEYLVTSPDRLPSSDTMEPWDSAIDCFTSDNALFLSSTAHNAEALKKSGADYTIFPMPKFNESQDSYNSTVSPLASMFAVLPEVRNDMKTASRERTGTVLEYMAYKSECIVFPAYAESILYSDEGEYRETDLRLLATIKNSTRYEFCQLYTLTDITTLAKAMFLEPESAKITYSQQEKKLSQKLSEIYESLPSENGN